MLSFKKVQGLNIHFLMLKQPKIEKSCTLFAWSVGQDYKTWT
jgi:hypothetical protein